MSYTPPGKYVPWPHIEEPEPSRTGRQTNHAFHLLMTVLTFGTWAVFVWPWVTLWNRYGPRDTGRHYKDDQ